MEPLNSIVASTRDLYLFTNEYPYGKGETFIETELKVLSKRFNAVYLFPLRSEGIARDPVASNIKVVSLFDNKKETTGKINISDFFTIVRILLYELRFAGNVLHAVKVLPSALRQNLFRAERLHDFLKANEPGDAVFYSFWLDDWATVLSILKQKNKIPSFVSRVHGYDVYLERWPGGLIPFRYLQLREVSGVFAASRDGLSYLNGHYPAYRSKFHLSHLGIFDSGTGRFDRNEVFTIVSCSNLVPLKRVHLIAKALKYIDFDIKWIHFGEGPERRRISELIPELAANVSVILNGHVSNAELIKFYQTHHVNAFLHMSETEGGVSLVLQEAASFGIPLIGCVVGGTAEIINEQTGVPLAVDISPEQLAEEITRFRSDRKNSSEFRAGVKSFWKNSFDAEVNYLNFYKKITDENRS